MLKIKAWCTLFSWKLASISFAAFDSLTWTIYSFVFSKKSACCDFLIVFFPEFCSFKFPCTRLKYFACWHLSFPFQTSFTNVGIWLASLWATSWENLLYAISQCANHLYANLNLRHLKWWPSFRLCCFWRVFCVYASLAYWSCDTNKIKISLTIRQRKGRWKKKWVRKIYCNVFIELYMYILA